MIPASRPATWPAHAAAPRAASPWRSPTLHGSTNTRSRSNVDGDYCVNEREPGAAVSRNAKRLVVLEVESFPILRHWYIVQRQGKRLSAVATRFREYVIDEAGRVWQTPGSAKKGG